MRTYTDAPLLVRADTGKRLREADLDAGGAGPSFVAWDAADRRARSSSGTDRLGLRRRRRRRRSRARSR